MASIGELIKQKRLDRKLSQVKLAKGICTPSAISQIEAGKIIPTIELLRKLADRLAVPVSEIVPVQMTDDYVFKYRQLKVLNGAQDYAAAYEIAVELDWDVMDSEGILAIATARVMHLILNKKDFETARVMAADALGRSVDLMTKASLHTLLGHVFRESGDWLNAYLEYSRSLEVCVQVDTYGATYADICYHLGVSCKMVGKNSEASAHLHRAQQFYASGDDLRARAKTAYALAVSTRSEEMMSFAERCYDLMNEQHMTLVCREFMSYYFGEPSDAIPEHLRIAEIYLQQKDYEMGIYSLLRGAALGIRSGYAVVELIERARDIVPYLKEESANLPYYFHVMSEYALSMNDLENCKRDSHKAGELYLQRGMRKEAAESLRICVEACKRLGLYQEAIFVAEKLFDHQVG